MTSKNLLRLYSVIDKVKICYHTKNQVNRSVLLCVVAFQSFDKKSDDDFNSRFCEFDQCAELLIKNLIAFVS